MGRKITLSAVAKEENVHPNTIKRWVHEGKYPKPVTGNDGTGRHWKFDKDIIAAKRTKSE